MMSFLLCMQVSFSCIAAVTKDSKISSVCCSVSTCLKLSLRHVCFIFWSYDILWTNQGRLCCNGKTWKESAQVLSQSAAICIRLVAGPVETFCNWGFLQAQPFSVKKTISQNKQFRLLILHNVLPSNTYLGLTVYIHNHQCFETECVFPRCMSRFETILKGECWSR